MALQKLHDQPRQVVDQVNRAGRASLLEEGADRLRWISVGPECL